MDKNPGAYPPFPFSKRPNVFLLLKGHKMQSKFMLSAVDDGIDKISLDKIVRHI